MTTEQQNISTEMLPITAILEERAKKYHDKHQKWGDYEVFVVQEIEELLPEVRTLEESSQKKAKESERERIVEILEEMKNRTETRDNTHFWSGNQRAVLQIAIERIKTKGNEGFISNNQ